MTYIKRENALNAFSNAFYSGLAAKIKGIPSEDVAPVRHGRWSKAKDSIGYAIKEEEYDFYYVCSSCGRWTIGTRNYCPNCGAKMDGDSNEID